MTYDGCGNMLTKGSTSFIWTQGRKLAGVNNGKSIRYEYDHTGNRVKKVVDGATTEYRMAGRLLLSEKRADDTLQFHYDTHANMYSVRIGGTRYLYMKNLQNDITGLLDVDGNQVVEYKYDSWGNTVGITGTLAGTVGVANPFRYRGYYLDAETGMYYVSSRYYDPGMGRFISPDAAIGQIGNVQSYNMFAYCFNNPVKFSDPTGNWPKWSMIFTVVAAAAVAVAAVALTVMTCGAAAPVLAITGGGVIGGVSAGIVATGAVIVAGVSTAAAVTAVVAEKTTEKATKRNNSVYVLKDDSGTVQYVDVLIMWINEKRRIALIQLEQD